MAMLHPTADIQSSSIGVETKIWQYSIVLPGAKIGNFCNINAHCFVENDVVIGNYVTLKCGVYLWDGIRIDDHVFIGPNVTFSNDKYPRSKVNLDKYPETRVEEGASIGAGAVILPGLTIGARAMVGAGAVVVNDVAPYAIVVGNPARQIGLVGDSAI